MNITFVIPAYNAEKTLVEAVDSVFAGNFEKGDEVIIVNDCSKDSTLKIAESLAQRYTPNVTVISNAENKGCPASRNAGITRAKSDLIFNLDSDNVLAPGNVAKLKNALIGENADAAVFSEQRCFPKTTARVTHVWVSNPGIFTLADIFAGIANQASGGNYLYRKATWKKIGGYWEYGKGMHEAWGFTLKMLLGGAKYVAVPGTFYFHRYSHQSLFVRESRNSGEASRVSNLFIQPALPILEDASRTSVLSDPDWHKKLPSHPLFLKDGSRGSDGRIVYLTLSGKTKQLIKRFL